MMLRNKYVQFALYLVCFFIFWNLLDFLYDKFITGNEFQFETMDNVVSPLIGGIVISVVQHVLKTKRK